MLYAISFIILAVHVSLIAGCDMPAPFYRALYVTSPYMKGDDVTIAQSLLKRDSAVDQSLEVDGVYGEESSKATASFQAAHSLPNTGVLDCASAQLLMDLHSEDNYKDSGFTAASMGYLYKFHIPVYTNRSIETYATLFDKDNNVMLKFKVRAHGHRDDGSAAPWPDYGDGDIGYTEYGSDGKPIWWLCSSLSHFYHFRSFCDAGNTVTGLIEMDLNSPEPDPQSYGPWPVNRFVHGLDGNAAICK
jgi:hypothetical protein